MDEQDVAGEATTYFRKGWCNANSTGDNVSDLALLQLLAVVSCIHISKKQVGSNFLCIKISVNMNENKVGEWEGIIRVQPCLTSPSFFLISKYKKIYLNNI